MKVSIKNIAPHYRKDTISTVEDSDGFYDLMKTLERGDQERGRVYELEDMTRDDDIVRRVILDLCLDNLDKEPMDFADRVNEAFDASFGGPRDEPVFDVGLFELLIRKGGE
jgi:hypothetical protein